MKIFAKEPITWQELQNMCAEILLGCGYEVEVEKSIKTVRENVNVDVFAIKSAYPKETIIIECKFWQAAVPKTIAHSFRTVISDYGANSGYIISKMGFQVGVYNAVENTNISLMTFNQFQDNFKIPYLKYITTKLQSIGYPLRKYADYVKGTWDKERDELTPDKQKRHLELCIKYDKISLASLIMNYKNIMTGELELDYIDESIERNSQRFPKDVKIESYSDYFNWLINFCETGVTEFDTLFGRKLRKE